MIPSSLLIHKITVKEYKGNGPYGPLFDDPYEALCYFEKKHELVRDSTGQEIVSSARAFMSADYEPPPKSIITFEGDDYEVITSARFDNPIAGAKPHHTEVTLK
jgi:hypothetical protein